MVNKLFTNEKNFSVQLELAKSLRAKTGAGIMDCIRALTKTGPDLDAAAEALLIKGKGASAPKGTKIKKRITAQRIVPNTTQGKTTAAKQLQVRTGATLVDCRKALYETRDDPKAALQWLKERGLLNKRTTGKQNAVFQNLPAAGPNKQNFVNDVSNNAAEIAERLPAPPELIIDDTYSTEHHSSLPSLFEKISATFEITLNWGGSILPTDSNLELALSALIIGKKESDEKRHYKEIIFYGNKFSLDKAVMLHSQYTSNKISYNTVKIDTNNINSNIERVVFYITCTCTSHDMPPPPFDFDVTNDFYGNTDNACHERDNHVHFGLAKNAHVQIVDKISGQTLADYDLTSDFSGEEGVIFGELIRHENDWSFQPKGQSFADGLAAIARTHDIDLLNLQTTGRVA